MKTLSIAGLVLMPLLACAAFAGTGNPVKDEAPAAQAPPSGESLKSEIDDTLKMSADLQNSMKVVKQNVTSCNQFGSEIFASKMDEALAGLSEEHARIKKSLDESQKSLDEQLTQISKAPAAANSKAIASAINAPVGVIEEELQKSAPNLKALNDSRREALSVLSDTSTPGCRIARQEFTQHVMVYSNKLPEKLRNVQSALDERKASLSTWVADVKSQAVAAKPN